MKLTNFLKKITPLPWRPVKNRSPIGHRINSGKNLVVIGTMNFEDASYASHAANVLPELVEAVELYLELGDCPNPIEYHPCGHPNCPYCNLINLVANAGEVKVEGEYPLTACNQTKP